MQEKAQHLKFQTLNRKLTISLTEHEEGEKEDWQWTEHGGKSKLNTEI